VRLICGSLFVAAAAWAFQAAAVVQEKSHQSQVMGAARTYRIFLPPAYATSQKRYPAIYWFHGYEAPDDRRDLLLSRYVASHDVLLVDSGPAETSGNFPLYLAELIDQVDRTLRTVADRGHRAVTGFGTGGFVAMFDAAKSPDLVGSASSFQADREAETGPEAFPVTTALDDLEPGLESVGTWVAQSNPDITAALDFHMKAFAAAAHKPEVFSHADPYPNFKIWDWDVASDRRSPGFTVLENAGRGGFRSAVREWLPGGASPGPVKLSITSAKLYTPGSSYPVTYVHLADGKSRQAAQKADAQGRLSFDLTGDAWEVGVGAGPVLAAEGYTVADASWATAGKPVNLKVNFLNKGAARSQPQAIRWESPSAAVKFESTAGRVFGLAPGETAPSPVTFTYTGGAPATVRLVAVAGTE